jgi:hypothetical protein
MPEYAIGTRRDAHLEMERLAREQPYIYETAVQSLINIHADFFTPVGPDLRHRLTGVTIEDFVKGRRASNPNDYSDFTPVASEAQIMHEVIENACLRPSPASLARLYKALDGDERRYHAVLKEWNTDPARMLPGVRPGSLPPEGNGADDDKHSNPWRDTYHGDAQQREDEKARLLRAIGIKGCTGMAKKAGVTILGFPL